MAKDILLITDGLIKKYSKEIQELNIPEDEYIKINEQQKKGHELKGKIMVLMEILEELRKK